MNQLVQQDHGQPSAQSKPASAALCPSSAACNSFGLRQTLGLPRSAAAPGHGDPPGAGRLVLDSLSDEAVEHSGRPPSAVLQPIAAPGPTGEHLGMGPHPETLVSRFQPPQRCGESPSGSVLRSQSGASLAQDAVINTAQAASMHTGCSSSSMSRASSARSTSSVQAVPFRTPNKTPARTPAISRTASHAEQPASFGSNSVLRVPSASHNNTAMGIAADVGGGGAEEPITEPSAESHNPSMQTPAATIRSALASQVYPADLNPPGSARQSFLAGIPGSVVTGEHRKRSTGGGDGRGLQSVDSQSTLGTPTRPDLSRARTGSASSLGAGKSAHDFKFGEILGEGSYSTVYHATDKNAPHRSYAIKVLDKRHIAKEKKIKYVAVERDTLNKLDRHPGCLRLYWTFQDASSLYYVLEYAANGEILKAIKQHGSFSEDCARFYAAQILSAVEHMHSRGVIHRDLKPENILLDQYMRVKMADFGSAKILKDAPEEERAHSFVGTAEYVSPELLTEKVCCKSSDYWAFGCVLYQLIAGQPPFKSRSEYLTFRKITSLDYAFPEGFPADAKDLVQRLLVLDPSQRIGAAKPAGIDAIKSHPFLAPIDWAALWTAAPPPLKTGLVAPALAAPPPPFLNGLHLDSEEEMDPGSELSSAGGGPRAEDEPPLPSAKSNGMPKPRSWLSGHRISRSLETIPPPSGSGMTMVEVFLPNELMIYSSPVIERKSLFHKKRTLIVTDYPRLLCIKEEKSSVRVKHEILFRALPHISSPPRPSGTTRGAVAPKQDDDFLLYKGVEQENDRVFLVHTSKTKTLRFEAPSGDAERWTAEISLACAKAGVPKAPGR